MTIYLGLFEDDSTMVFNAETFIFRGDHLEITTCSNRLWVYPIKEVKSFMVVSKEV